MIPRSRQSAFTFIAAVVVLFLGFGWSWWRLTAPAAAQTGGSVLTSGPYQIFVQPGAFRSPVLHLIRSAHTSLRLEVYLLTDQRIVNELQRARTRGVDVRVLLEEHPYGAGRYAQLGYSKLQAAGIPVRWANESAFTYTHEKSMEIDGTTAGIFTFNFSSSGFLRNREFGLIEQSSRDARAIAAIFDADWNRRTPHVSSADLVVSPYNSRRTFDALIDGARRTLDLYAEEVNDSSIEDRLVKAIRRGVRVRLIVPSGGSGVDALIRAGVAVRLQPTPYVHAKTIVQDGHTLYLGSENISGTSLDHNREMGIKLGNGTLARFVEASFAADWAGGGSAVQTRATAPPSSSHTGRLRVRVSVTPHSLARGETMTIAAHTQVGATCTVQVLYPSHRISRARSVRYPQTAGSSGTVSWMLTIGTSARGPGTATVRCMAHGASATASAPYEVT